MEQKLIRSTNFVASGENKFTTILAGETEQRHFVGEKIPISNTSTLLIKHDLSHEYCRSILKNLGIENIKPAGVLDELFVAAYEHKTFNVVTDSILHDREDLNNLSFLDKSHLIDSLYGEGYVEILDKVWKLACVIFSKLSKIKIPARIVTTEGNMIMLEGGDDLENFVFEYLKTASKSKEYGKLGLSIRADFISEGGAKELLSEVSEINKLTKGIPQGFKKTTKI